MWCVDQTDTSCAEPVGSLRPVQGPFEVFWRADVIGEHVVRGAPSTHPQELHLPGSRLLRDSFGAQRNFRDYSTRRSYDEIHRQAAEETQLLVGIFKPLCERQRRMNAHRDPFMFPAVHISGIANEADFPSGPRVTVTQPSDRPPSPSMFGNYRRSDMARNSCEAAAANLMAVLSFPLDQNSIQARHGYFQDSPAGNPPDLPWAANRRY